MGQSPAPTGHRSTILRHAYLLHHGGRITASELARVIRQFRAKG